MKRVSWIVATVLIANGVALLGVARNARAPAEAVVTLTEREMGLTGTFTDNTGMTLGLAWDREAARDWFDRAKLAAIGFDCSVDPNVPAARAHYSGFGSLPRETYVVLEYDPNRPPAAAAPDLAGGESAGQGPSGARTRPSGSPSRLRPIDVGNDAEALRTRYSDRHRYIVTAGIVRASLDGEGRFRVKGRVVALLPNELYVPREWQPAVVAAVRRNDKGVNTAMTGSPRYEVTVEYGRSLLPRVVAVKQIVP